LHDLDSCGRKRKPENMIPTDAVCVNWQHPLLWSQIVQATAKVGYGMSPLAIATELKRRDPEQFARITPQVIGAWIDRSGTRPVWKPEVIQRAQNGNQPPGRVTRTNILAPYPHIVSGIVDQLRKLRKAGIPLNVARCRGIMVARLHHAVPQVFQVVAKDGSVFRCSESWVMRFIYDNLKWSFRRATRAAQKTPDNADELCHQQFLRHAITARDTAMPSAGFRVNIDQTNIVYQCASSSTYEAVGASQVAVVGKDEKRAFTLLVGISDSGDVLPFQVIFQGSTQRSCPTRESALYEEAMDLGFKFEFLNTDTYWSTFDLMCKYVHDILVPYFTEQKDRVGANEDQECILQLDVWAVHRSVAFRTWLDENYSWIIYLFVPGGCTGIAQPCDVGIQRPLKLSIKHSQHADVVDEMLGYLEKGTDPANLRIDTCVGILQDRAVGWLV
jgi:DDE superfamily endonuclease